MGSTQSLRLLPNGIVNGSSSFDPSFRQEIKEMEKSKILLFYLISFSSLKKMKEIYCTQSETSEKVENTKVLA